jgi:hypothetical protein
MNWHVGKIKNDRLVYSVNFIIFIVLSVLMIICLNFQLKFKDIVFAFWIADAVIIMMLILLVFANSYKIKANKMIVFDSFKKKMIEIDQVPMIVVTNNVNAGQGYYVERVKNKDGKKVPCPVVSLVDENVDIEGMHIDYPMKNWDVMSLINQKSDSARYVYGFLANKNVVEVFKKNYRGNIYIARTVYENFNAEITESMLIHDYTEKRIKLIEDCNKKGDWCNSPYL